MVGSAIIRNLLKKGYTNLMGSYHSRFLDKQKQLPLNLVQIDLINQEAVRRFFEKEKPEYVILAAAMVGGIHANNTYPADFIYNNLCMQNNVIHSAYLNNITKLLFLGSSCIYPKECPQPMKEEYLLSGYLESTNEPYAVAKIAGIKMCEAYNRQYNTNYISVMPTNLFGSGDNFDLLKSHVLPAMIRKFHLAKLAQQGDLEGIEKDEEKFGTIPDDIKSSLGLVESSKLKAESHHVKPETSHQPKVVLWGTGTPKREFLHVDDLADACIYLMNNYSGRKIVNIGTGKDSTIRELAELIQAVVGFEGNVIYDSAKPDGTMVKRLDVSRLNNLGWKAKTGLKDGISKAYEWYREQYVD